MVNTFHRSICYHPLTLQSGSALLGSPPGWTVNYSYTIIFSFNNNNNNNNNNYIYYIIYIYIHIQSDLIKVLSI